MSAKKNERTLKMLDGFMKKHEEGLTISEIAKFFDISVYTIYDNLQAIADANNTTRNELLTVAHNGYNRVDKIDNIIRIDVSDWRNKMETTKKQFTDNEVFVSSILEQNEEELSKCNI